MRRMDVIEAIRTRRTVKAFRPDPVPREQLERILGAARWAPNHRLTQPWRFRHVGPVALGRLMSASGDEKLLRAREQVLRLDDLRAPAAVFLGNALRGLLPVIIEG